MSFSLSHLSAVGVKVAAGVVHSEHPRLPVVEVGQLEVRVALSEAGAATQLTLAREARADGQHGWPLAAHVAGLPSDFFCNKQQRSMTWVIALARSVAVRPCADRPPAPPSDARVFFTFSNYFILANRSRPRGSLTAPRPRPALLRRTCVPKRKKSDAPAKVL